jgi:hypothetical protein
MLASLYARFMMHQLGTRRDDPGARLMRTLSSVSPIGLLLVTGPVRAGHRVTGYVPRVYRYPYEAIPVMAHQPAARTTFYDRTVEQRRIRRSNVTR